MKALHLSTLLAAALLSAHAADKGKPIETTFYITEVKCASCAAAIDESLRKLPTVTKVEDLSQSTGYAIITFDPAVVSHHQIAQAVFAADPVHGDPYVATLKFTIPDYAKADNAAKVDALLAQHKSQVRAELKNKARREFLLTFEPLRPDNTKKGPPGWTLETFRASITEPAPKGLGLTLTLASPCQKKVSFSQLHG